jgi:hypothetical protein
VRVFILDFRDLLEGFGLRFVPLIPSQSEAEGRGKKRRRKKRADGGKGDRERNGEGNEGVLINFLERRF